MSGQLLILPGAPALSGFRIEKLLARIAAMEPAVTGLASHFVHFASLARPLSDGELRILQQLLTYGPRVRPPSPGAVTPSVCSWFRAKERSHPGPARRRTSRMSADSRRWSGSSAGSSIGSQPDGRSGRSGCRSSLPRCSTA